MVMQWIKMWIESRGRLPTYLLVGGLGPNVVHACNFVFKKNEYKICLLGGRRILAHVFRGPRIFGLQLMLQRTKGSGSQLMFSETQDFWILAHVFRGPRVFGALAHVFRGPKVLDPSSCFQRSRIFGSWLMFSEDHGFFGPWLMFSEDQRFRILAHVFRDLEFLDLGSCRCVWPFILVPAK